MKKKLKVSAYRFRKEYEWPKYSFSTFYKKCRENPDKSFEDLIYSPILEHRDKIWTGKRYDPMITKPEKKVVNEWYNEIRITYSPEVANVFRKEYNNIQEQIDDKITELYEMWLTWDVNKLYEKQNQIKKELEIFNLYNKTWQN